MTMAGNMRTAVGLACALVAFATSTTTAAVAVGASISSNLSVQAPAATDFAYFSLVGCAWVWVCHLGRRAKGACHNPTLLPLVPKAVTPAV